jgi:hypothetical protein
MSKNSKLIAALCGSVSAVSLFASTGHAQNLPPASAPCPATVPVTLTPPLDVSCLAVIQLPGNKLNSFDISWDDPFLTGPLGGGRYFLGERSNAGIDVINVQNLSFIRRLTGFAGVVLTPAGTAINNNVSGPNGVVSHNLWVYGGDGNSTLKVFNLNAGNAPLWTISTIGAGVTSVTRVDEMDITPDGLTLLAANNIEDPPFATQFIAEGDAPPPGTAPIPTVQWSVDPLIMPPHNGLSLEQPRWDQRIGRFVVGVPIINTTFFTGGAQCNYGQSTTAITCDGGLLVINPLDTTNNLVLPPAGLDAPPPGTIQRTLTAWSPAFKTGIISLTHFTFPVTPPAGTYYNGCSPNGVSLNPNNGVLDFACTPGNNPSDIITGAALDSLTNPLNFQGNYFPSPQVTGGDEIYFNFASCTFPSIVFPAPSPGQCAGLYGDQRFYIGASKNNTFSDTLAGFPNGTQTGAPTKGPVLGIQGGSLAFNSALGFSALPLIGTIPVSSGSHSVATDAIRNYIFVPFVAPACKVAGCNTTVVSNLNVIGGDTTGNSQSTSNSQLTCGTANGCIAVYRSAAQGSPN